MEKLHRQDLSKFTWRLFYTLGVIVPLAALVACSGGAGDHVQPSAKFPLVVNVSGLKQASTLLISDVTNTNSDDLLITADGTYQFGRLIQHGEEYSTKVKLQPDGQLCTVTNSSGVGSANMVVVSVTCSSLDHTFVVGGYLVGLQKGQVVLRNNSLDKLTVSTDGQFQFSKRIPQNSSYNVIIEEQPPGERCAVTNGKGTRVEHDADNVFVACELVQGSFTIGGSVAGLTSGNLVLNNLTADGSVFDTLTINTNSPAFPQFTFDKTVVFDGYYKVTVAQNPAGQICSVNNDSGYNVTKNVPNVAVQCVAVNESYTISGKLSGLDEGQHITLNNSGENLPLSSNGKFTFIAPVANGGQYNVLIVGEFPLLQDCSIKNGTGTVKNTPVQNVLVSCSAAPVDVVYSFPDSQAHYFPVGLIRARDGTFYGTATSIELSTHALNHTTGYIFTMTNGVVSTPDTEGDKPDSWCFAGAGRYWNQPPAFPTGIMQANDGNLYGTTFLAETTDAHFAFGGATYKLDTSLKTLLKNDFFFPTSSNSGPIADLIQDESDNFYGITYGNTWVSDTNDGGSIFKRSSDGAEIDCPDETKAKVCTLYSFQLADKKNGVRPNGRLTLVKDPITGGGFLYGIAEQGGTNGKGVIFRFDLSRLALQVIASFDDTATHPPQLIKLGELFFYNPYERPYSGLTQATDGNLYGVAKYGGKNNAGRIFKLTPPNTFRVIYEFEKNNGHPVSELIQLTDGNLYGVTQGEAGNLNNMGSIFRVKPDGTSFTTLHLFADGAKNGGGKLPSTRLVEANDGKSLYGGTQSGGSFNQGTIYRFERN